MGGDAALRARRLRGAACLRRAGERDLRPLWAEGRPEENRMVRKRLDHQFWVNDTYI